MGGVYSFFFVEVGDGLSDFDDFEVGTGGEVELFRGGVEESFGGRSKFEESGDLVRGKGRVKEVGAAVASVLAG